MCSIDLTLPDDQLKSYLQELFAEHEGWLREWEASGAPTLRVQLSLAEDIYRRGGNADYGFPNPMRVADAFFEKTPRDVIEALKTISSDLVAIWQCLLALATEDKKLSNEPLVLQVKEVYEQTIKVAA